VSIDRFCAWFCGGNPAEIDAFGNPRCSPVKIGGSDATDLAGDSSSSAFLLFPCKGSEASVGLRIDEKPVDLGAGKLPDVTAVVGGKGGSWSVGCDDCGRTL